MKVGIVKWFDEVKGYGFIIDENEQDVFFHYSEVVGDLNDGDTVNFEVETTHKGIKAVNVSVVE